MVQRPSPYKGGPCHHSLAPTRPQTLGEQPIPDSRAVAAWWHHSPMSLTIKVPRKSNMSPSVLSILSISQRIPPFPLTVSVYRLLNLPLFVASQTEEG